MATLTNTVNDLNLTTAIGGAVPGAGDSVYISYYNLTYNAGTDLSTNAVALCHLAVPPCLVTPDNGVEHSSTRGGDGQPSKDAGNHDCAPIRQSSSSSWRRVTCRSARACSSRWAASSSATSGSTGR